MAEGGGGALKWIGIGCGLFLLLGMCAGGGFFLISRTASAPVDASASLFADLRRGNYQQALQRMNTNYQSTHPVPTFQQNVQQIPALTTQTAAIFEAPDVTGDTASVTGNLSTPSGQVPVTLTLSRVSDHWYVDSVMVQGQLLQ